MGETLSLGTKERVSPTKNLIQGDASVALEIVRIVSAAVTRGHEAVV